MCLIIKNFKKYLNKSTNKINKEIKKRSREISFKDVIYYSSLLIGNNQSYNEINGHLKIKNILNISTRALIKYKNGIYYSYFRKLNDGLINYIYKDDTHKRLLAADGINIFLHKLLEDFDFKVSRNKNYCTALIGTLFDIELEMPINYMLSLEGCERKTLMRQSKYLREGDILIMDRGYYSKELLFHLVDLGVNVIFRLASNLNITKLGNELEKIFTIKHNNKKIKLRVLQYCIQKKIYYIGTTIYDEPSSYFKETYWKRWKIEINFRHSKYNLSMNNIKSKSKNTVLQDICIHGFIFIVSSYLLQIINNDIRTNYKISLSSHLKIFLNNILYLLFYKTSAQKTINEILRMLNISKENLIYVKPNRYYERIKKKPSSKWCQYGNKYKMSN